MRLTKQSMAGPRMRSSLRPTASASAFAASARAAARRTTRGTRFLARHRAAFPALADEIDRMQRRDLPDGWDRDLPSFPADAKGVAGRDVEQGAGPASWLLGGSADLGPPTRRPRSPTPHDFEPATYGGRNFHYGIREHAMAAMVNGMALTKLRPYGATFAIFSDYARFDPALGADGDPVAVDLHARRDGRRRGRAHAIADRAAMSLRAMPDDVEQSGRRQRGGRGVPRGAFGQKHRPTLLVLSASRCRPSIARATRRPRASRWRHALAGCGAAGR
ncbi:MAG: hypothetical protein U1F10_04220 [Burkholderiales bacterium]